MAGVTITERVSEMEASASAAPDPRLAAFAREREALAGTAPPPSTIAVGAALPDAELLGADGSPRTLGGAVGDGLAVLVLYRGAWCPYCNLTLRTYQTELLPALRERGAALVAVSPQAPDGSLSMQEKNDLEFAVLSDPGNVLARAAGVLTEPTAESRRSQLELGLDLAAVNADGGAGLPMPTAAILDPSLTVRWIDVHPNYATRSEPTEILAALDVVAAEDR